MDFSLFSVQKTVSKNNYLIYLSIFIIKSPNFGEIGASFIFKFGEIETLQNSGNLLKIRRDWSLLFGEIEVPELRHGKRETTSSQKQAKTLGIFLLHLLSSFKLLEYYFCLLTFLLYFWDLFPFQ